jgi:hypothetical protein
MTVALRFHLSIDSFCSAREGERRDRLGHEDSAADRKEAEDAPHVAQVHFSSLRQPHQQLLL